MKTTCLLAKDPFFAMMIPLLGGGGAKQGTRRFQGKRLGEGVLLCYLEILRGYGAGTGVRFFCGVYRRVWHEIDAE